jgi:hypothetical protein
MVRKIALRALALTALLVIFSLYTRPPFLVMLADQLWACF